MPCCLLWEQASRALLKPSSSVCGIEALEFGTGCLGIVTRHACEISTLARVNDSEAQPYNIDDVRLHRLEICTVWFYGIERAVNEQALTNAETSSSLKRLYV